MDADALVRDYLGRLDAAAAGLAPERRAELEAEVREHIEAALVEAGTRDEVTLRNVLDRLGSPAEIVAAEAAGVGVAAAAAPRFSNDDVAGWPAAQPAAQGLGAVEIVALLLLTVGSFLLPFVGPLLGLVFVWISDRWDTRAKIIASAIVLVLLILPLAVFFGAFTSSGMNAPQVGPAETIVAPMTYAP